jgi:endonuclease YncB( thermonuclease family)
LTSSRSVLVAVLAAKRSYALETFISAVFNNMTCGVKVFKKGASVMGALFLCLCVFLFGVGRDAFAESIGCSVAQFDLAAGIKVIGVKSIVDGDTIVLSDGRKVRFIGINTPEIGRKGKLSEPFAQKARKRLIELLGENPSVKLKIGEDAKDRYGRLLAHVFTLQGESVEVALIREGLGFAVSFPPNLLLQPCLVKAQQEARRARLGVWSDNYFAPRQSGKLRPSDAGFRLARGVVEKVYMKKGGSWWLLLEGKLALMIPKSSQDYFNQQALRALIGQKVLVSGWLIKKKLSSKQKAKGYKPYMMSVRHSDAFVEPAFK